MEYGLEVVPLPVSDTDKAKDLYQGAGLAAGRRLRRRPRRRDLTAIARASFWQPVGRVRRWQAAAGKSPGDVAETGTG